MPQPTITTSDGRVFILPSDDEDVRVMAAALADPDARPMTDEQLSQLRSAREVLPPEFFAAIARAKAGRLKAETAKVSTSIRLDADLLASFKATGKGWQTRINAALRQYLQEHPMAR